jgi:hypothetical protein
LQLAGKAKLLAERLSDGNALRTLTLTGAFIENWDGLRTMTALEDLELDNGNFNDLSLLTCPASLKSLDLRDSDVNSLEGLWNFLKLSTLWINRRLSGTIGLYHVRGSAEIRGDRDGIIRRRYY